MRYDTHAGRTQLNDVLGLQHMNVDFHDLWQLVAGQFHSPGYSVHGPDHWRRVERNGSCLQPAPEPISRSFVYSLSFTTVAAVNDGGIKVTVHVGAEYAATLRGVAYELSDDRFEILHYACVWHTDGDHHADPTIATCWDADRLDLGRVGIIPSPEFMSTDFGREIAAFGSIQPSSKQSVATQWNLARSDAGLKTHLGRTHRTSDSRGYPHCAVRLAWPELFREERDHLVPACHPS
jgi:uncharacterized protein